MTAFASALLVAAALAAAGDWIAVAQRPGARALEYLYKPLTLVLLLGVAATLDPAVGSQRGWFLVALALCLVGDVFLMLPTERFVAGLGAFLLGHLAYVAGLVLDPGWSGGGLAIGVLVMALVGGLLGRRVVRAVRRSEPGLVVPVVAYAAVISAMVAAAVGTGDPVAIGGAALFFVSDATIALTRFEGPRRGAPVFIMVTYHAGQALLVLSLP